MNRVIDTKPNKSLGQNYVKHVTVERSALSSVKSSIPTQPHVNTCRIFARRPWGPVEHNRGLIKVHSTASASFPDNQGPNLAQRIVAFKSAFWKFLRPHTIRGTILGTSAVVARALLENSLLIDWALLPRATLGLLALLCGNGYIVGINQIYDVDIDMVNKPFLPIAAGELSPKLAWLVVIALAGTGVTIVANNFGPLITSLYTLGLFLGTVYSLPPLRLKRFPIPAFLIIATVRGLLLNFGVYYATRAALGLTFSWSPPILFITMFVTVFATVIAVTKDLPDVQGDKANNIETFATKLGVEKVSLLSTCMLLANYIGAVVLAFKYPTLFNMPVMAGVHALLGVILVYRAVKLKAAEYKRDAILDFYRWIWNLFYAEYCCLPFI